MQNQKPKNLDNFMFDTNIFDRILDGNINTKSLNPNHTYFVTHIQYDELNKTPNIKRRNSLIKVFSVISGTTIPTESVVMDVSRFDLSKLGDANLYEKIKKELDKIKKKPNNIQDSLIGEASIKNHFILVTDDKNLRKIVKKLGGTAISFSEFQKL